jgi:NitT/TauT family transport system ATP-binding protein
VDKIRAEGVSVLFSRREKDIEALSRINLEVSEGEFVSLVGPSGCGKSTFLRIVAGLLVPTSGKLLIDGAEVQPGRDRALVFQQDNLLPWRSVLDNVAFGLQVAGCPKIQRNEIANRFINTVGLIGFETSYPYELSGGMRQRANLARALAIDPQILLMDEPFASLDAQTREIMQAELLRIWQESRKTAVFVTHQIDEAVFLSDRVVVLTARPGTVREVIRIAISRPRSLEVKRNPDFIEYVDRIWRLLEADILKEMRG